MKPVSNNLHLMRRNGVYYYRRRVPDFAVAALDRKVIQYSLKTHDKTRARKQCEFEDVRWSARFDAIARGNSETTSKAPSATLDAAELVRQYVERTDERSRKRLKNDPPRNRDELAEQKMNVEMDLDGLRDPTDPNGEQWVAGIAARLLSKGASTKLSDKTEAEVDVLVRRGLLELGRRHLARLDDDYSRSHYDTLFDPTRRTRATFKELADQYVRDASEDAEINGLSRKRMDKVKANVVLIQEIVGGETPTSAIDYDACLRVRNILARTPTNRTKLYPQLSLDEAIAKAKIEGKPVLSATTQSSTWRPSRASLNWLS
jgi:hypothetical protein